MLCVSFFIPDYTVASGASPDHSASWRIVECTTDWDLNPCLPAGRLPRRKIFICNDIVHYLTTSEKSCSCYTLNMEVSPVVQALFTSFEDETQQTHETAHISVSKTVSILARIYEKARNAVEFRAEHLVRRAAIERILKRRIMLNGGSESIAENLVLELLWAKYIDSGLIGDVKVQEIHTIIARYLQLKSNVFGNESLHSGIPWETILGLASSEIEDALVSAKKREALNNFFYQAIRPKIILPDADERYVNMQTYISVERIYAQSDDALVAYELMKLIEPTWFGLTSDKIGDETQLFFNNLRLVGNALKDPIGEPLNRFVRIHTPPFLLLRDFFLEFGPKAREITQNAEDFEHKLSELASRRYHEIGAKVQRAVVRSIIYIFLTKMVFAFALEAPVDIFITKRVEYLALAINAIFPPILLYLVAGFVTVPGADNTQRLIERIKTVIFHFDTLKDEKDVFNHKPVNKRPLLTTIFSMFYLVTFLVSFGFISFILTKLHFNIASQIIFVFFVTLVSFFAYRIKVSAKEYEMTDHQGFLGPIIDFFFLPILRVGHVLSREIAKINIFIFFFDFILEAPLKVIFEVVEEWIRFIRTKKDEII